MILRKLANTHSECQCALEKFFTTPKAKCHVRQNPIFEAIRMRLATFAFEMGMKTEKSPSAYVWNHKIRLKHRTMLPFVFADRYDLKKACKYIYIVF